MSVSFANAPSKNKMVLRTILGFFWRPKPPPPSQTSLVLQASWIGLKMYWLTVEANDWIDLAEEVLIQVAYWKYPILGHDLTQACFKFLRYFIVKR